MNTRKWKFPGTQQSAYALRRRKHYSFPWRYLSFFTATQWSLRLLAGISSTGSLQPLPHPRHSIPHYQELSVAGVRPLYPRATTFTCHATGRQRGTPTLVPHAQTCRGSAAVTATHSALTLEIRVEFQVRTQMCLSRSTRKRGNRCYEIWYEPMSRMRYQTPRSMFAFPAAKTGHTLIAVWTMTGSKSPYSGSNNHSGVHHLRHYKL